MKLINYISNAAIPMVILVIILVGVSEKKKVYELFQEELDFLDVVDGGILSYQDQVIKPDEAIYQLLLERYQLLPEECVFLDDLKANLVTADRLGMHTILFTVKEEAEKELRKLNVLI